MRTSIVSHAWVLLLILVSQALAEEGEQSLFADSEKSVPEEDFRKALSQDDASAFHKHVESDLRVELADGRVIDIGKIFQEEGAAYQQSLRDQVTMRKGALVRVNYRGGNRPMLVAGRRGRVLHGSFASFTDAGEPVAYASYQKGDRDSTMFTWDDQQRPLVFAQYDSGELHGLRCLFRACCDSCKNVHVWAVQEWERGKLSQAHVVLPDGKALTLNAWEGHSVPPYRQAEFEAVESAVAELASFERKFDKDESRLRQLVSNYYLYERQVAASRANLVANQNRYRAMMGMLAGSRPSFAAFTYSSAFS